MNKIPQFFRKSKSQTGEAETSPTKEILTPAELEKLKKKVKAELTSAELRIDYIKGRQHRLKEGDSREIERLEADIAGLELKYKDLLDPNFVIYKQRKEQRATPSTLKNNNFALLNPAPIKQNRISELFDYTEENDQAQAQDQTQAQDQAQALDQAQAQAAPPRNVEELASQCANCNATVSHSAYATVGQCSRCKVVIKLTTPVERTNTLGEETQSYEEARRNYFDTRFPPFISIFDIRHRNFTNRFPQDDTLEDQLQYFRLQPRNNEGIQEEDFNLQQEDNEEQNNPIEQEQDEVRQEQELNLEEEDNEEQENPVQEEEAEVQQNQRRSTGLGQLFDPTEVLDN